MANFPPRYSDTLYQDSSQFQPDQRKNDQYQENSGDEEIDVDALLAKANAAIEELEKYNTTNTDCANLKEIKKDLTKLSEQTNKTNRADDADINADLVLKKVNDFLKELEQGEEKNTNYTDEEAIDFLENKHLSNTQNQHDEKVKKRTTPSNSQQRNSILNKLKAQLQVQDSKGINKAEYPNIYKLRYSKELIEDQKKYGTQNVSENSPDKLIKEKFEEILENKEFIENISVELIKKCFEDNKPAIESSDEATQKKKFADFVISFITTEIPKNLQRKFAEKVLESIAKTDFNKKTSFLNNIFSQIKNRNKNISQLSFDEFAKNIQKALTDNENKNEHTYADLIKSKLPLPPKPKREAPTPPTDNSHTNKVDMRPTDKPKTKKENDILDDFESTLEGSNQKIDKEQEKLLNKFYKENKEYSDKRAVKKVDNTQDLVDKYMGNL